MSYCPKCARLGLRRRVKRNNRIKINGVWYHKKCPNLTAKEMEHAKRFIMDKEIIKNNYLQDGIEWEEYDFITECEHCEQTRRCCLLADPFISEVYPEDSPETSYWCIDCYSRRKDQI